MNRKHNPWVALVGLLLGLLLVILCAGCGYTAADAPLFRDPVPAAPTDAAATAPTETAATQAWEPANGTPVVAYPWTPEVAQPVGFKMGDTAWIVLHYDEIAAASTHSAVVIAEIEGYLITAPQYCGEGADLELMWDLVLRSDDGRQCLDIWPIGDCYANAEDAQAAVDKENTADWYLGQ